MRYDNFYVRFDWAAKQLLREKSNFVILEGLLTVLLNRKVTIVDILESESNQKEKNDKYNRVDVMAKDKSGELFIVEIQQQRQYDYYERMLYGVSKTITEYMELGDNYQKVKKIYSINILYFNLGKGDDFLYHGTTVFRGINTNDILQMTERESNNIHYDVPSDIFPEYYLIRVNQFNKEATNFLEEWIAYFKDGKIREDTKAPGLKQALKKLNFYNLTPQERREYEYTMDCIVSNESMMDAKYIDGREDGREEGLTIGRIQGWENGWSEGWMQGEESGKRKGVIEMAAKMKNTGIQLQTIANVTGLTAEELADIR